MPEDAAWADPVVVPDDIRELQADVDAYHRERRLARRRMRWQRLTATRAWQRWSFPAGVLTGAVALAAAVFALLAVDGHGVHQEGPAPLATRAQPVGEVGGLLPDVSLTDPAGGTIPARSLRPALVALLPQPCGSGCDALLNSLAGQAQEVQLRLVVIGPTAPDAEVASLPGRLHYADVVAAFDHDGALRSTYDAHGVAVLVLGRDGVVTYEQNDVTPTTRLEQALQESFLLPSGS